jgi:hypothetical protein
MGRNLPSIKEKLQADLKVDFDDYQTAKGQYEQWEQLSQNQVKIQESTV